jgi:dynein heavy chain
MFPPGTDGRKRHEATGIWSPDGEWLPLLSPVVTEGRPESWLGRVEDAMFATTRKHLLKVLEDSKSEWRHRQPCERMHQMCGKGSSMDQTGLDLEWHCLYCSLR